MFNIAGQTSEFFKETPGYQDGDIFLLHGNIVISDNTRVNGGSNYK